MPSTARSIWTPAIREILDEKQSLIDEGAVLVVK